MSYCTSCGSRIPEGQGRSCSMCYGDIAHGKDGYYEEWARRQDEKREQEQQREETEGSARRLRSFTTYHSNLGRR